MTKTLSIIFGILGYLWVTLFVLLLLASIVGMYIAEPSFAHFWRRLTETFSPFNISNFLVMIVTILPAIGFFKLSDYFKNKSS
jgi:hypothetical protein